MIRPALVICLALVFAIPAGAQQSRVRGEGEMCGGIAGFACSGNLWCEQTAGMCQGADIAGTCVRVSPICTPRISPGLRLRPQDLRQ